MILALLVNLICLDIASPPAPVMISAVKSMDDGTVVSGDAQCNLCPCWRPPLGQPGCALMTGCSGPCGYVEITSCPACVQWGAFTMSDEAGCVDMDLLPVPQDGWVYWVTAP
jgi:hypothetical protein